MLYLNDRVTSIVVLAADLTLTSVVFELNKEDIMDINPEI